MPYTSAALCDPAPSAAGSAREFAFTDAQFEWLSNLASQATGIVLTANKKNMVYGRLIRRLRALRLDGFDAYCRLLQSPQGVAETGELINAVTTNITRFFREPHHFEALSAQLTALVGSGKRRLRLWSAGCSSGMEPYSMAMTVAQQGLDKRCDIQILATDLDTAMLDKASAGHYTADEMKDIPTAYQGYLQGETVGADIRRMVRFNRLNLLEDWPMRGPLDAVFCRNVVIYFDKPTKQRLFDRIATLMAPDGLLYIGHSENLHNICDRFELVGRTIYRRLA